MGSYVIITSTKQHVIRFDILAFPENFLKKFRAVGEMTGGPDKITVISVQGNVWPQNYTWQFTQVTKFDGPVAFNRHVIDKEHESGGIPSSWLE